MIVLFVFLLLLAFATGEILLYRFTYFLALVIVGSYVWTRLSLRRLDIRIEKQASTAEVGSVLEGLIRVENNSPLPIDRIEVAQLSDMPGHLCGGVMRLPGRRREVWKTQRFCYARGVFTVGPVVARSSDPLGLFGVQRTEGEPIKVVIYPPVVELPCFSLPVADLSGDEMVRHRPETRSSHAAAVREYQHGDSLNRIHWPSTARCGHLMSKDFDSGGFGDVWLVVDLERTTHQSRGTDRTDEYGVAVAASLTHLALTEERSVGLIAYGDEEYLLPLGSGARQMSRVLETLTRCKTDGCTSLAEVLFQNTAKLGRFVSLIVVTSSGATEWVSVLQNMTRGGLSIAVVLVDPASFGGDQSCSEVVMRLLRAGIPAYVVRRGDSLTFALGRPVALHGLSPLSGVVQAS